MLKVLNILQYQMSSKELVLYAKEKKLIKFIVFKI